MHKLINTGDYLLIVDDSEIKEGDWVYCWETINRTPSNFDIVLMTSKNYTHWVNSADNYKKVISHLPLNNSPILEGVDILPPLEDEVEKLAKEEIERYRLSSSSIDKPREVQRFNGFKTGYNKAKEKYKYTEEDMLQAAKYGYEFRDTTSFPNHKFEDSCINNTKQWLQSLQQPQMPVGFKCEMVNCDKCVYVQGGNLSPDCCNQLKPKTTTNSQGLTQWVGEYIY